MNQQSRTRAAQLIDQFPAIGHVRSDWQSRLENDRRPWLRVAVQRADKDAMFLQARNVRHGGRVYVQRRNGDRGIRYEYLCAIGKDENIVAQLAWESPLNFGIDKFSKDIFADVDPEEVSYLLWITFHGWYKPSTAEQEAQDVYFSDTMTGAEITAIVYLKPKDMGWSELVRTASDEKFEQEEAYKYPPKDLPELPGIHQALRDGCRLRAFMSGGGLRVIRLEKRKQLKAYGEFPHVEEALQHADEQSRRLDSSRPDLRLHPGWQTGYSPPGRLCPLQNACVHRGMDRCQSGRSDPMEQPWRVYLRKRLRTPAVRQRRGGPLDEDGLRSRRQGKARRFLLPSQQDRPWFHVLGSNDGSVCCFRHGKMKQSTL